MSTPQFPAPITSYSLTELSSIFQVTEVTLRGWFKSFASELGEPKEIDENGIKKYSSDQVKVIFNNLTESK